MWIIKFLLLCLYFEYIAGRNLNATTIFPPENNESAKSKNPVCCPSGFFMFKFRCFEITTDLNYTFEIPDVFLTELTLTSENFVDFHPLYRVICEQGFLLWVKNDGEIWHLIEDERAFLHDPKLLDEFNATIPRDVLGINDYCWDDVIDDSDIVMAECYQERITYPTTMILALPFLIATFFVYAFLPELRNIYGMSLMAYIASTFLAYVAFILVQLGVTTVWTTFNSCIVIAFVMQFSFLSSFFWLNIMCFDIWWTFGGRVLQGRAKSGVRKRFIIYCVYAWGCPSIITSICVIMQFVPGIPDSHFKPYFGMLSCWFEDDYARLIFFEGPIGITILCNVYFFVSTALKIRKQKKDTADQLGGTNSRRNDQQKIRFSLYLKFFIVMGITWSIEIFLWLWPVPYSTLVTGLAHTIEGIMIFIIFVCKNKIRRSLLQRCGCQN